MRSKQTYLVAAALTIFIAQVGHGDEIVESRSAGFNCREAYPGYKVEPGYFVNDKNNIGCYADLTHCQGYATRIGPVLIVTSTTGTCTGGCYCSEVVSTTYVHTRTTTYVEFFKFMSDLWTGVGVTLGLVGVPLTFFPPSAAFGAALSAMGAISGGMGVWMQRIAEDPPDPNYQTVYEYPARHLDRNWGFSPTTNDYLNETILKMLTTRDALEGLLTSNERMLGALEGGDVDMVEAQIQASRRFQSDAELFSNDVARRVARLPLILASEGMSDSEIDQSALDAGRAEIEADGLSPELASLLIDVTGEQDAPGQFLNLLSSQSSAIDASSVFSVFQLVGESAVITACSNGRDDDSDGLADYPADPGCQSANSNIEDPQCDNGIDDDGNGLVDFDDSKCQPDWPYWEKTPACGLGGELALVLPVLAWLKSRNRRLERNHRR